jgi:glycosyltransferase involved in cell wall biosynthesis
LVLDYPSCQAALKSPWGRELREQFSSAGDRPNVAHLMAAIGASVNILFLHPNMPAQFKHLAPALARDPTNRVIYLTKRSNVEIPGVQRVTYKPPRAVHPTTHTYLQRYENAVLHGQQVVRVGLTLQGRGFVPDLVIAHSGWGDAIFIKDVFPNTKFVNYAEFYYSAQGADAGFGETDPLDIDKICRVRMRNSHLLQAMESCDRAITPTQWQRDRHPVDFHHKLSIIFDGVDTAVMHPDSLARFTLKDGRQLTQADEVITYVSRNLEPYRGFPTFIRALPEILRRRPSAQVVIVGGDEISYSPAAPDGKTWKDTMLAEVGLDLSRVHFTGRVSYESFRTLMQVSSVHVYLTVPFILSWSCVEAMATGCIIVGSRTPPVQEFIEDGRNGFLVDFFDHATLAKQVDHVLTHRDLLGAIRRRARDTVLAQYSLADCLPRQMQLLRDVTGKDLGSRIVP